MDFRRKILSGAGTLAAGQAGSQICSFIRNVIIARIISKDDFGIASTFILTITLLEMISSLAADRLLVQAEDGDDPTFLNVAHSFQVIRSVFMAGLMFLLAGPVAWMFKIPDVTWAFQMLAIVPLMRAFLHLDIKRMHRHMRFGPEALATFGMQLIPMLLAYPVAKWLNDYRAVLLLLFVQIGSMVIASHIFAERKYRWSWDVSFIKRLIVFGWPLLINGLLMFATFQGDRLVVGTAYTMEDLADYGVAFTITLAPAMMLTKVTASLFLPVLASAQNDMPRFNKRYRMSFDVLLLISCIVAAGFIITGQPVVTAVFGDKYQSAGLLAMWLGVMQSIRLLRTTQANAAIARADTTLVMFSNVQRSLAFFAMIAVGLMKGPLWLIAACGVAGELLSYIYTMFALKKRHNLDMQVCIKPLAILAGIAGLSILTMRIVGDELIPAFAGLIVIFGIIGVTVLFACPDLRNEVISQLRRLNKKVDQSPGVPTPSPSNPSIEVGNSE